MAFPLGAGELSTLRVRQHWRCDLYRLFRTDGKPPLCVSSHDTLIPYEGQIFRPTAGEQYDERVEAGMAAGTTELVGVVGPNTVSQVDIQRGVFDDQRLDQIIFDWRRRKRYRTNVWWIDEVVQDGDLWRAQLSTMGRFLQQTRGEAYYGTCPRVLGDHLCKVVVPSNPGTVTSVADPQMAFGSGVAGATGYYALGFVKWTSGNNRTRRSRVYRFNGGNFQLSEPTRFPVRVGDTFLASPGCDGRATTCKNTFANLANFRGNERQGNARQLGHNRGTIQ